MSRYPTIDTPQSDLDSNDLPYENGDPSLAAFGGRDAMALGRLRDLLQQGLIQFGDRSRQEAQDYREQLIQQRTFAHESAANDALTRFRHDSLHAFGAYSATRLADALSGYDGYRQGLQTSRTAAMSDLSSAARSCSSRLSIATITTHCNWASGIDTSKITPGRTNPRSIRWPPISGKRYCGGTILHGSRRSLTKVSASGSKSANAKAGATSRSTSSSASPRRNFLQRSSKRICVTAMWPRRGPPWIRPRDRSIPRRCAN